MNCHLPITATGCIVSQVQARLCVAVDNQIKAAHSRAADPVLHLLISVFCEECFFLGFMKDIE